jgi:hypothetical protein
VLTPEPTLNDRLGGGLLFQGPSVANNSCAAEPRRLRDRKQPRQPELTVTALRTNRFQTGAGAPRGSASASPVLGLVVGAQEKASLRTAARIHVVGLRRDLAWEAHAKISVGCWESCLTLTFGLELERKFCADHAVCWGPNA